MLSALMMAVIKASFYAAGFGGFGDVGGCGRGRRFTIAINWAIFLS